ncbi:lipoyl(octanoyl) transferase LipB [bacterium]|nr:lipoyl(octanoyl) transferase LipB [bacterium]
MQATFVDLGRMEYQRAWDLQRTLQEEQIAGNREPMLLFVEHPPTITIGRRGESADVVAPTAVLQARGIAVTETDRGGQVTYHGPGQLVAYPLVNLQDIKLGLHEYMRALEEAVIQYLATLDIKAGRVKDRTGVWVGKEKICAMGIRVRRWWTLHGLALNVRTDLNHFGMIVPCGIRDRGVTSLGKLLGDDAPTLEDVKPAMKACLAKELGLELIDGSLE